MTVSKPTALKNTELFKPIKVGKNELSNKVVFAPTTRTRALEDHTPSDLQLKYYDDRSRYPGSLLITEATFVSEQAGLYERVPGIWNDKQTSAWKRITDKVHENGSFISCQFWFLGRVGDPKLLKKHGLDLVAPSALYENEESKANAEAAGNPLRELTEEEIKDIIYNTYTNAAENAIKAGFDYIELHAAHGYLLDQFLQPSTNVRTDKYGGSIENRARFVLELIDHLIDKVGAERLAIRISPWAKFQGMKAEEDEVHPIATFSYLLHEIQKRANAGKQLAYVSVVEPRVSGIVDVNEEDQAGDNTFVSQIWKGVLLKSGNYTYDAPHFKSLLKDISDDRTLVGFSRYYTSNPDLVNRLAEGYPLTPYDRNSFYAINYSVYANNNWGYNTFSVYGEDAKFDEDKETKRLAKAIEPIKL